MACFCCSATENLIFLLIYLQRKADLNTSEKLLVFVTVQHNTYAIRPAIIYESFIFTQKYAFAERYCFLTFSFKGKLRKYDISVKRKHTKSNENITFSALFTNFRETKILFLCSEITAKSQESHAQTSDNMLANQRILYRRQAEKYHTQEILHLQSNNWVQNQQTPRFQVSIGMRTKIHYQLRYLNPKESIQSIIFLVIWHQFMRLRFISPVHLLGKTVYQKSCELTLPCDQEVPTQLVKKWNKWLTSSPYKITIPRSIPLPDANINHTDIYALGLQASWEHGQQPMLTKQNTTKYHSK